LYGRITSMTLSWFQLKVGDLVLCRGKAVGIIIKLMNQTQDWKGINPEWAHILWNDNHCTWEEVEPSFVPGVIEVISEDWRPG